MESVDEVGEQFRGFGMAYHHQYDGNALGDGNNRIALHGLTGGRRLFVGNELRKASFKFGGRQFGIEFAFIGY